uniref:Uncharacterized protein n=1 Tax=Physcomitrium patens TaxID=3218 RepID=A0A2K1IJ43_PHYPA|nr:hypothetical protein PHYPA_027993 [Physcomitrium patens]
MVSISLDEHSPQVLLLAAFDLHCPIGSAPARCSHCIAASLRRSHECHTRLMKDFLC